LVVLLCALGLVTRLAFYKLGKEGWEAVADRFPQIKPEQWDRGRKLFETQGAWIVVLAVVPGLGMVISASAGAFGVKVPQFVLWVTVGLLVRYWLLLMLVVGIYSLVTA
jgi:membrane protein YqaA with SNARE-associated domain